MADPRFPVGGRGLPRRLRFVKFVCQNKRIGSLGGARRVRPLDPPMTWLRTLTPQVLVLKFFPVSGCHYNWQPIHQSFTLGVTMEPSGHLGWLAKQEFKQRTANKTTLPY